MKRVLLTIAALSVIFILAGIQAYPAIKRGSGADEISDSGPNSYEVKHLGVGEPYLKKGLLYLGIMGVLIVIWLLLKYKV